MKKGQTMSMDLLLGLTVFLVIFIAVFGFINYLTEDTLPNKLKEESELILSSIESQNSPVGFIKNNQIDEETLNWISIPSAFNELKSAVGSQYNFCIYFEDENGNLLNMNGEVADLEYDQVGIGDDSLAYDNNLKINGIPCGVYGLPEG